MIPAYDILSAEAAPTAPTVTEFSPTLGADAGRTRIVDRVLQIHGGMGYTRELPIERWYRQVRLFRIFEGTDEMLRLIVSRDLLRGYTQIGGHLA